MYRGEKTPVQSRHQLSTPGWASGTEDFGDLGEGRRDERQEKNIYIGL